jgi:hypothetical protein
MKLLISLLIIPLVLFSCNEKVNSEFSKNIETKKTENHKRIEGTKVFGIIPEDFKYHKEAARYQKNENLYVLVMEMDGISFNDQKPNLTRKALEEKGAKVDILNNIYLNEFEAIYLEGPSKIPNETKLLISFGDDNFQVMVVGVCKTDDEKGKNEIQSIFKSIYYENSMELDPMELANFEFDNSITGFKNAMAATNIFMYTIDGEIEPETTPDHSINIALIGPVSEISAEDYSKDLIRRYKLNGDSLENENLNKTTINGYTAFVLESKIKSEGKNGVIYQAVLTGTNNTLLFLAHAYADTSQYLNKYKETAETIIIK